MTEKRKVEVFSAGCSLCEEAITMVKEVACSSCDVTIHDMTHPDIAERAKRLGITSVPAVVINGKLANCCADRGPDAESLRAAGLGHPLT